MQKSFFLSVVCVLACHSAVQVQAQNTLTLPKGNAPAVADPVSYMIGLSIGQQLKNDGFLATDLRPQDFMEGVLDSMSGKEPKLTQDQLRAVAQQIDQVLTKRMQDMEAKQQQELAALKEQMKVFAGPNLEKSRKFLEENKAKPGVKTLPSGLQYSVINSGTGAKPKATDVAVVHYEGKNVDGKVFDSSKARGQPAKFPVGNVVKGWSEGLQLMSVGDKWMLYLPPELAYGEDGVMQPGPDGKPVIGPNEALVFEVELLEVVPGQ